MNDQRDVSIPLVSRRRERALLMQKLQHAVPACALLYEGWRGVSGGERGFALALAVTEIAASVLLLVTMARAVRAARRAPSAHEPAAALDDAHAHHAHEAHAHGVDWIDILVGVVLLVEAASHWRVRHHVARPTLLMAAVTIGMGLSHGRVSAFSARRRALRLDATGLRVGGPFFRRFSARWDAIERIDVDARAATIVVAGGRTRRIDLDDLRNGAEVAAVLRQARVRLMPAAASVVA